MNRQEAVDYLHNIGYSRRMSAKLADIAMLEKDNPFIFALKKAIQSKIEKSNGSIVKENYKDKLKVEK